MKIEQLELEIEAYTKMKAELIRHHSNKYVIIKDQKLQGSFDTFDSAAKEAIQKFGQGPYLIRRVSEEMVMPMPASVAYRSTHAPY